MIGRATNIFSVSGVINLAYWKSPQSRIKFSHQVMLVWGGLRGAMAFALAAKTNDAIMLTTTMVIVVLTVVLLGSSTNFMLNKLGIPINVHYDDVRRREKGRKNGSVCSLRGCG